MILMQDGRLFYTGSHVFGNGAARHRRVDLQLRDRTVTDVAGLHSKDERDQSISVLLPPAQDQRVLTVGGGNIESNPDANRLADRSTSRRRTRPTRRDPCCRGHQCRRNTSDGGAGEDVPLGGHPPRRQGVRDRRSAAQSRGPGCGSVDVRSADEHVHRGHGNRPRRPGLPLQCRTPARRSGDRRGNNPGDGSFDSRLSIYSPPYLFKGARPAITGVANANWAYGSTQQITVAGPVTPRCSSARRRSRTPRTPTSDPSLFR